jgi:integrase
VDADGEEVLSWNQAADLARRNVGLAAGGARYTVEKACADYLVWARAHSRSPRDAELVIKAAIAPRFGTKDAAKLTTTDIRKWHNDMATSVPKTRGGNDREGVDLTDFEVSRRRRATANRRLTVLKAVLNHAFRDGRIPQREAWARVKPFRGAERARQRYLTPAEVTRLVNTSEPGLRELVQAALFTACRYSELTRLRVRDFHVRVSAAGKQKGGATASKDAAADKHGTLYIGQSKTSETRHVLLSPQAVTWFEGQTAGKPADSLILTKPDGSAWGKSDQFRPFRAAVKRAKLGKDVVFHSLRHTWASLAIMNEMQLMLVARQLGHKDTRMVERTYGHLARSYEQEQIRTLAPSFEAPTANVTALVPR